MYNWKDKVFDEYPVSFYECDHKNEDGTTAYVVEYSDFYCVYCRCKKCGDGYVLSYSNMK